MEGILCARVFSEQVAVFKIRFGSNIEIYTNIFTVV